MGLPTCLTDPSVVIVSDTSTVISLNATGCALEIIRAIPNKLVVVDVAAAELDEGRHRGRRDADLLAELVIARVVEIVKLDEPAGTHFETLVVGPATTTLDDGEAATIAYAVSCQGTPVIDERKATRICAERYPTLQLGCTVDILAHSAVESNLGKEMLSNAVFNALHKGRMRVLPQHVKWVIELIGPARAAACASLPKSVRQPQQNVSRPAGRSKNDAV
jgi:predicted nucleic acid-binding protein